MMRNRRKNLGAVALGVALAAAGCGKEPAVPIPAPSPPAAPPTAASPATKDPAVEALARRLCDVLHTVPAQRRAACCGTTPTTLVLPCTEALAASVTRGAVGIDTAQLDRCAEAMDRELAGCEWVTPLTPLLPRECSGLLHGKLPDGARCRSSMECGDGRTCRGVNPTGEGVCGAPTPVNARCAVPADNLVALARAKDDPRHPACEGNCIKGTCLPWVLAGEACDAGKLCASGLLCVDGTCKDVPLPAAGEPCAGTTGCASGLYCDAGVCRPLKKQGDPCKLPFECRGLTCPKEGEAKEGACGPDCGSGAAPPPGGVPPVT